MFISFVALLGLIVGSFLNVVIYRLPKMMERAWKQEALAFLRASDPHSVCESPKDASAAELPFNLAYPPSRCGHCGHTLHWYENIPLLSWGLQRAKCRACGGAVSARYPLVEALTALTSAWIAHRYGWTPLTAAALIFNAMLICAFWIDWDTQLLPDNLTMPLMWGGLILAYWGNGIVPFPDAFWGAIAGYGVLWCVYWLFYLLFKKEGMGFGDFKLLSALGAWLGWSALPVILLIASLSGLLYGLIRAFTGVRSPSESSLDAVPPTANEGYRWSRPLPFGPFLIAGAWIVWMILPANIIFNL